MVEDTAYVESAQACGLHLSERRDPERGTSFGVGQMIARRHRRRSAPGRRRTRRRPAPTTAAPVCWRRSGPRPSRRRRSSAARTPSSWSSGSTSTGVRERCEGIELVIASDVDNPLLGLRGATNVYGPQKGVTEERKQHLDAQLERFGRPDRPQASPTPREPARPAASGSRCCWRARPGSAGSTWSADAVGLADHVPCGRPGRHGGGCLRLPVPVRQGARTAWPRSPAKAIRPCIALAGQVLVGSREMRALGVESAYSMVDLVGEDAALEEPHTSLAALAERVARTWSR